MPIKKDSLKKILLATKISKKGDDGKLTAMTEAEIEELINATEEKELSLPEGLKVFTPDEYSQLETNLKDSGKAAYIRTGKDVLIKDLKEKLGLEFEGKDADTFIEKAKEKIIADAKLPANEQKQQWEADKKTLQSQVAEWKGKYESEVSAHGTTKQDSTLLKKFPTDRNTSLSDEDRLLLLKSKVEIKNEDGKEVVYYKGQRLQDNLTNPLPIEAAIKNVFEQEKWIGAAPGPAPHGRGGGGGATPGTFKNLKEVNAEIERQGIHIGSEKAQQILKEAMKNPEFDATMS